MLMSDSGEIERARNRKGEREEEEAGEKRTKVSGFEEAMEEDKSMSGDASTFQSSLVEAEGDRQRFAVELRPGETTIVSWRKLVKDAGKLKGSTSAAQPPPFGTHLGLESRIAPGQPSEKEMKDEPQTNRFSAVIEKIERLYMGKDSSDEEDLNDCPDDNQYDTEDSFIDDAELDEYFEVDNSETKHNGFFVNRGKLERINETALPNQQMKKRRRKELIGSHGEGDVHAPTKHMKLAKKPVGRPAEAVPAIGKYLSNPSQNVALTSEQIESVKTSNHLHASVACKKKKNSDLRTSLDPPPSSNVLNGDAVSLAEAKDVEKHKAGVLQPKHPSSKIKDSRGFFDDSHKKFYDRSQLKSYSGKQLNSAIEQDLAVRAKEKNGIRELPDLNIPEVKYPMQTVKMQHIYRRDGPSARPKSTMLERAIRELEKLVAESRPPTMEVQDADNSAQAIKRRLPRDIKAKLGKVARLAQSAHGKISKELLNRLMSILGHLIQLRTLKRNLKVMINTSLSAKKEKESRFQQIKREVVEMIKMQLPSKFKASEQLIGTSDDFQEAGSEEKAIDKRNFSMESAMEDKLCDLYDLYVDGLDEDAGPQIRKLYAELANMWPNGFMDNHGIKRAICSAKARRKALYSRKMDLERSERKKLMSRTDETVRAEAGSGAQPQYVRERLAIDPGNPLPSPNRQNSSMTASAIRQSSPSISGPSMERPKQEKMRGSLGNSTNSTDDTRAVDATLIKKKVKKKPGQELGEGNSRLEKSAPGPQHGEDRQKLQKQAAAPPKPNNQLVLTSSTEQLS